MAETPRETGRHFDRASQAVPVAIGCAVFALLLFVGGILLFLGAIGAIGDVLAMGGF